MVVDGVAGKLYEEIVFDEVSFSPNSARAAYVATDRGYSFAVVDEPGRARTAAAADPDSPTGLSAGLQPQCQACRLTGLLNSIIPSW